ncbi:MAG: DsbA family oxidoreductase [Bacteroidota bacterium]
MQKIRVDIISDVVCPWCYLGKASLEKAIALAGENYEVSMHWYPYELNPEMPAEGMSFEQYLRQKFGEAEKIQRMLDHLTKLGAEAGIGFHFDQIAHIPNTFEAHRLLFLAAGKPVQHQLATFLFEAYFGRGENVGDKDYLAQMALEQDVPVKVIREFTNTDRGRKEILTLEDDYRESGINAVPTYIFNQRFIVQGAQSTEVFMQIFEKLGQEVA